MSFTFPDRELVPDAFLSQLLAQTESAGKKRIGFADRQNDLHLAESVQRPGVVKLRKEVRRGVKVYVLIVESAEQVSEGTDLLGEVIAPAQSD